MVRSLCSRVERHSLAATGVFRKLIPFAAKHDTRLVLINRRDFPGSDPYSEDDRRRIAAVQAAPDGLAIIQSFMDDRARELHDFLVAFVKQEAIPRPTADGRGGIVLTSWSWGGTWLTAFVSNLRRFPASDVDLHAYIRRFVLYGESAAAPH